MENQIIIEYCVPCGFENQARQLAQDLGAMFSEKIGEVTLEPTRLIGSFEVFYQGELVFSKKKSGRLPQPGEVEQILFERLKK
ncbi:MAG: SelT/SelW/SelH family protein [Anaerolineae bacterium]|jgi:selenoprotein W-related protein|nr:SelT/SelW/SelH family protein [Anaerolineae bacterium]